MRGLYRGYIGIMEKKMETIWGLGFPNCAFVVGRGWVVLGLGGGGW